MHGNIPFQIERKDKILKERTKPYMKSTKITNGDIADMKISTLPTRPTAPQEFGGKGFTTQQMKEAFDKLPLYIVECFNRLIDDITGADGDSITDDIKTDIYPGHNLKKMFWDITSGEFASYLTVSDSTLSVYLLKLREDIDKIAKALKIVL